MSGQIKLLNYDFIDIVFHSIHWNSRINEVVRYLVSRCLKVSKDFRPQYSYFIDIVTTE